MMKRKLFLQDGTRKFQWQSKSWICWPFCEEQLKAAVVSIEVCKAPAAPGQIFDAFVSLYYFFHKCWDFIKTDLVECFEEQYSDGKISMAINST